MKAPSFTMARNSTWAAVRFTQAIEEGIAIVYQELTLVPSMTVGENVYLGKEPVECGSD